MALCFGVYRKWPTNAVCLRLLKHVMNLTSIFTDIIGVRTNKAENCPGVGQHLPGRQNLSVLLPVNAFLLLRKSVQLKLHVEAVRNCFRV